jgi:hypothetical protein
MSSGWLMAKSSGRSCQRGSHISFARFGFRCPVGALRPAPGATTVGVKIKLSAVLIFDASAAKRRLFPVRAPQQGLVLSFRSRRQTPPFRRAFSARHHPEVGLSSNRFRGRRNWAASFATRCECLATILTKGMHIFSNCDFLINARRKLATCAVPGCR